MSGAVRPSERSDALLKRDGNPFLFRATSAGGAERIHSIGAAEHHGNTREPREMAAAGPRRECTGNMDRNRKSTALQKHLTDPWKKAL